MFLYKVMVCKLKLKYACAEKNYTTLYLALVIVNSTVFKALSLK